MTFVGRCGVAAMASATCTEVEACGVCGISSLACRAKSHSPSITTARLTTAIAEPNGQSRFGPNCCWIALPSSAVFAPPSRSGITNCPVAGTKTSVMPAASPGMICGSTAWRKTFQPDAPRSRAASASLQSIFSTDA